MNCHQCERTMQLGVTDHVTVTIQGQRCRFHLSCWLGIYNGTDRRGLRPIDCKELTR